MISILFQPLTPAGDVFVSDVEFGGLSLYVISKSGDRFDAVCTEDDTLVARDVAFDAAVTACNRDYSMTFMVAV